MKCEKCFFCTRIGAGIFGDYPIKYCKRNDKYITPFVKELIKETGEVIERSLDFSNEDDLKVWVNVGCDIHPSTVAKAKREALKELGNM